MSDQITAVSINDAINSLIAEVSSLSPDAPVEQVLAVSDRIDAATQRLREVKEMIKDAMKDFINANGEIEIDTVRWYVGVEKIKKCKDNARTIEIAYEAVGGDADRFSELLGANAFKPGACSKVMTDEQFAECFEVVVRQDLKTGKPKKSVHKVDSRFLK